MSDKTKQLLNVVACSETMLKDAEAGNWEKVIDIEVKRSELLEQLFSSSSQDNNIEDMDDKIQQIIDINKKLESITIKARDNVRNDIAIINKGQNAVNMYAQNGT